MKDFENILVTVDVTSGDYEGGPPPPVRAAVAVALQIQAASGCRITLMSVVGETDVEARTAAARKRLEQQVLPLFEGGDVAIEVAAGHASTEIVRHVLRARTDLVVAGARAASLLHRTIVGSVAMALLRKCPCPVWVAPPRPQSGGRTVLSAVALHDLTPTVLRLSAEIVRLQGGEWHVFHCPEYAEEGWMRLKGAPLQECEDYERGVRDQAFKALHAHIDPLAAELGVEARLWMSDGLPSEQITLAARRLGADLVVLGTIGRVGLPGLLLGNTAERVLGQSETSVLAVKPEGFQTPVSLD